ncbi:MAG TPA: hypothetical protein PK867_14790 [Pirellulales bacterium]|nr:hypothetical protein [Pirellulales bacterium]
MVTIRRRPAEGGCYFEIANFRDYVNALQERGIEPPKAEYRFFVSSRGERELRESPDDWRRQLEVFYRLGNSTDIPCRFADDEGGERTNPKGTYGQETNHD